MLRPQDTEAQGSLELSLVGDIEICDAPPSSPSPNIGKKDCGMPDPDQGRRGELKAPANFHPAIE